jgi:hypothetical protein
MLWLTQNGYPNIHKLAILGDVAPYSRQFHAFRQKVGAAAENKTELRIEYEKILDRVRQTRESVIRMEDRHFTAPVDEVEGTIASVSTRRHHAQGVPGPCLPVLLRGHERSGCVGYTRSLRPEQRKAPRADAATTALTPQFPSPVFTLACWCESVHNKAGG